jgi:hypothetical protein
MGVASCNPVTCRLGDRGDATHECPADAKYVDVHGRATERAEKEEGKKKARGEKG